VHLQRHAGRGVGEGGEQRVGLEPVTEQRAEPVRRAPGREGGKAQVLRLRAARHRSPDGVEEDELCRRHGGGRQGPELDVIGAGGETGEVVHHRTAPPSGATGLVRGRKRPLPGFCSRASPFRRTWPRSRVIHGRPRAAQPSYGVNPAMPRCCFCWMVHEGAGSQMVTSASAPTRTTPLRGLSPKMRAGFSAMTRAIHVTGRPRLTTPSLHIKGTRVSSDGAPKGIGLPSLSTKMFVRPGSLAAGTRGE